MIGGDVGVEQGPGFEQGRRRSEPPPIATGRAWVARHRCPRREGRGGRCPGRSEDDRLRLYHETPSRQGPARVPPGREGAPADPAISERNRRPSIPRSPEGMPRSPRSDQFPRRAGFSLPSNAMVGRLKPALRRSGIRRLRNRVSCRGRGPGVLANPSKSSSFRFEELDRLFFDASRPGRNRRPRHGGGQGIDVIRFLPGIQLASPGRRLDGLLPIAELLIGQAAHNQARPW